MMLSVTSHLFLGNSINIHSPQSCAGRKFYLITEIKTFELGNSLRWMTSEFKFIYSSRKPELQNTALFTQKMNVTWVPGCTGTAPGAALRHSSAARAPLPGHPPARVLQSREQVPVWPWTDHL